MNRNRDSRNFGFGKRMDFAVHTALLDRHGSGHQFATVAAHKNRMRPFLVYVCEADVKDLRQAERPLVLAYAQHVADRVADELLAPKTGKNRISTVNVVLGHMRGDHACFVKPSDVMGRISCIRQVPPPGMDHDKVQEVVRVLESHGHRATADAVRLTRTFGLRIREAALLNLPRVVREAETRGVINVIEGTKGGRTVDRWVPVTAEGVEVLRAVRRSRKAGKLIGNATSFRAWYNEQYCRFRPVALEVGLTSKFHDLRAAYACDRYKEETGFDAPVIVGGRIAPHDLDQAARAKLALELGHTRAQILGSYVGGVREPKE